MRAHRVLQAVLALALAALLAGPDFGPVGPGAAQTSAVVLISDPRDDVNVTSGPLVAQEPAFPNVDVIAVSARQPSEGTLVITVTADGEPTDTQTVELTLRILRGPNSLPNSTATNESYALSFHAGQVANLPGATGEVDGNDIAFHIPLSAIEAVGGDILANVTVEISDSDGGSAPPPVTQDDSTAVDVAPDTGQSVPYTLSRPAVSGSLVLQVVGGTVQRTAPPCPPEGTCPAAPSPVPFVGANAATADGNSSITFELEATNLGLDADTVTLSAAPVLGADLSLTPSTLSLAAGASGRATLTVDLNQAPNGTLRFVVVARSANGGQAEAIATVGVNVVVLPVERKPVPEALGFLTPVVTAVGLDDVFGAYAELAFLLFVLLVAIVAVYVLMFTVNTPWVRVRVSPKRVVVAPGGVAEFQVEIEAGKRQPTLARATLRTEGPWTSGLQVGRAGARPGESMDIPLESGKEALPQQAILRVQVPYDATAREKQDLEFDVVPVDADGGSHPKHATRAKISVEAAAPAAGKYASARDIRLAEVKHDPPDPRPGATVRTTALIHNDGPAVAYLRVVLQKDSKAVAEDRIDVPPHDSKAVVLSWTAGAGRNLVKVQIFLA